MIHHLKITEPWRARLAEGEKTAEVRLNDRDYQVGDVLRLYRRVTPSLRLSLPGFEPRVDEGPSDGPEPTVDDLWVRVTHVYAGPGVKKGYVVLSFAWAEPDRAWLDARAERRLRETGDLPAYGTFMVAGAVAASPWARDPRTGRPDPADVVEWTVPRMRTEATVDSTKVVRPELRDDDAERLVQNLRGSTWLPFSRRKRVYEAIEAALADPAPLTVNEVAELRARLEKWREAAIALSACLGGREVVDHGRVVTFVTLVDQGPHIAVALEPGDGRQYTCTPRLLTPAPLPGEGACGRCSHVWHTEACPFCECPSPDTEIGPTS